jgi:S-adenosylmethionine hydrolase
VIVLFTDFGAEGPYVGQMETVLHVLAPAAPVVRLMSDFPAFSPRHASYLLASLVSELPTGCVVLAVVDPGVGGPRPPCALDADGKIFVGPGNGLFEMVARRASEPPRWWEIVWRPERLSASFHGRDLFAPMAARLWCGDRTGLEGRPAAAFMVTEWPDDLAEVVYIDGFGNVVTGLRASSVDADAGLRIGPATIPRARTFGEVAEGAPLCYENSSGLLEIAVNRGRADRLFGLAIGSPVSVASC